MYLFGFRLDGRRKIMGFFVVVAAEVVSDLGVTSWMGLAASGTGERLSPEVEVAVGSRDMGNPMGSCFGFGNWAFSFESS